MKRIVSLILLLAVCMSLWACGKSQAAQNCDNEIAQLGQITMDSNKKLEHLRNWYNGLTDKEKQQVSNYEKLVAAEGEYQRLVSEFNAQLKALKAAEPSGETLDALRQLYNCDATNKAISTVAWQMLRQYLTDLENGKTYTTTRLTLDYKVSDEKYLIATRSKSGPRVDIKSSYRLHSSEEEIRFYAGGALFSRTDMFLYNRADVCFVSWHTSLSGATSKENVAKLGMDVSGGMGVYEWPYIQSKDTLNEVFKNTTDADGFMEIVDRDLRIMGMPFTAWELVGIYDPDGINLPTAEEKEAEKMTHYPGTQIPAFDGYVDCEPQVEEQQTWTIYKYVHQFGESDTATYLEYTSLKGPFNKAFNLYEKEQLSQLELKTYYSRPESQTGDTCYIWLDGNGYALARRLTMNSSVFRVEIQIIPEAEVEAYVEFYFNDR